ncbi:MAG: HDIG domain-containing protein [Bacteroidota bacterium]|nr:HDIG domain-containing protein [Bacteroidota bacterium]
MKINIKKGILRFYVVALFILVYGAIVLMYPKERKFEYEFKAGAPWMHEDLIAEYDFPILKSDERINEEKDSIKDSFIPYFIFDTTVLSSSINKLETAFISHWNGFLKGNSAQRFAVKFVGFTNNPAILRDSLLKSYLTEAEKVYESGLIELADTVNRNTFEFLILRENLSYSATLDAIYVKHDLNNYMQGRVLMNFSESLKNNDKFRELINEFSVADVLSPNLVYDKSTNQKLLNEKIENLSLSSGMVQEGELIVQQGGIVDNQSYIVLQSLKKEFESNASIKNKGFLILGISLLYLATAFALFMFLLNFKPRILNSASNITFVLLQVLIFTGLAMLMSRYPDIPVYVIPFVIVPMLVQTFFDDRTALFVHIIVIMMVGFVAPNGFEFIFIQMITGIVAVFSLKNIQQRKRMFVTAFYVLLSYAVLFFSMQIMYRGGLPHVNWVDFAWFGGSALLILFTIPLIWVYEKIFGFISDATLMELADTNHPLLRKLAEKAPGSFQHSMQVANLAEAVGRVVGGNPLLIRTGALYHDIGKAENSEYFVENQSGFNPHDNLEYDESAKIIISHVTRGVKMAKKAKLPESIIDFIRTHHGSGKVQYFYRSYLNKYPDKEIDDAKFTYPGPSPKIIEHVILMMSDSIEAATRTLKEYSEESISKMVNSIIDSQLADGQFDHVDITLRKISLAKKVFTEKLLSIYHTRIEYPELNKKDTDTKDAQ